MWSAIEDTGKFLYKHRQKIAATTAVVGSAAFLYFYYGTSNDSITENITSNSAHFGDESYNEESAKNNSKELSDKKKLQLSRIRKQFENAREKFLPTLRVKIFEIVDVSDTIQEIRKLRNSQGKKGKVDSNTRLIEMQLWEKIKISSITILFVSVYMTSAICLILKIQFHLLGHYSYNCNSSLNSSRIIDSNLHTPVKGHQKPCDQNHSSNFMDMPSPIPMPASTNPFGDGVGVPAAVDAASSPSNTINTSYNRNNLTFNADIFLELIEKTYSYMLDRGIGELGDFIRAKAIEVFGSDGEESEEGAHEAKHKWNVLECKQVEYNDLISSFMQLRHSVEKDIQAHIIERVLLSPDADTSRLSGFSADSSPTNPSTRDSSPIKISGNKEMPSEYHGMGSVHNSTHHSKADNGFSSPSVQDGAAAPYTPSNSDSETGYSESGSNCDDSCSSAVQLILDQTWDVIESPNFEIIYQEAIDICFLRLFEELRSESFIAKPSTKQIATGAKFENIHSKTPAFATLLPQFKNLTSSVLLPYGSIGPSSHHNFNHPSGVIHEISNMFSLDSLCLVVFDMSNQPITNSDMCADFEANLSDL